MTCTVHHNPQIWPMFQGGMKAVLWADTLQAFIMLAGLVAVVIQGSLVLGGPSNIWQRAQQGGRINLDKYPSFQNDFKTIKIKPSLN